MSMTSQCPIASCWSTWVQRHNFRSADRYIHHACQCLPCQAEIMRSARFSASSPLCGIMLMLLFRSAVMQNELQRFGSFRPATFEAWKSFLQIHKDHIEGQCPQCVKALTE